MKITLVWKYDSFTQMPFSHHVVEALDSCLPVPGLLEIREGTAVFPPDCLGPEHARRGLLHDILLQGDKDSHMFPGASNMTPCEIKHVWWWRNTGLKYRHCPFLTSGCTTPPRRGTALPSILARQLTLGVIIAQSIHPSIRDNAHKVQQAPLPPRQYAHQVVADDVGLLQVQPHVVGKVLLGPDGLGLQTRGGCQGKSRLRVRPVSSEQIHVINQGRIAV